MTTAVKAFTAWRPVLQEEHETHQGYITSFRPAPQMRKVRWGQRCPPQFLRKCAMDLVDIVEAGGLVQSQSHVNRPC